MWFWFFDFDFDRFDLWLATIASDICNYSCVLLVTRFGCTSVVVLYSPMPQRMRQRCGCWRRRSATSFARIVKDRQTTDEWKKCGSLWQCVGVIGAAGWLAKRVKGNTFEFVEFLKFVATLCPFTFHSELTTRHKEQICVLVRWWSDKYLTFKTKIKILENTELFPNIVYF